MYTLTIVFNKERNKVLMCFHEKKKGYNFIGGKVEEGESEIDASYRELEEETGIGKDVIDLCFVRRESVSTGYDAVYSMYVTAGVLKEDVEVRPEVNPLVWVDITDTNFFLEAFGFGNCFTFLHEAMVTLLLKKGVVFDGKMRET